jgi:hypothetical protein
MMPKIAKPKPLAASANARPAAQAPAAVSQLAKDIQSSPRLVAQRKLRDQVMAGQQAIQQKPAQSSSNDSGMSAADKEMLIRNAMLAEEEEERKKRQ